VDDVSCSGLLATTTQLYLDFSVFGERAHCDLLLAVMVGGYGAAQYELVYESQSYDSEYDGIVEGQWIFE
jgi:hypothetical protein